LLAEVSLAEGKRVRDGEGREGGRGILKRAKREQGPSPYGSILIYFESLSNFVGLDLNLKIV
jgi:hypothetical protein